MNQADWQNVIIPGIYPMTWLGYAIERGIPVDDVLRKVGLSAEKSTSFSAGITQAKMQLLVVALVHLLGETAIGIEIGWRLPPTAFGSLGQAMLASSTGREALELCKRYWELLAKGVELHIAIDDEICTLGFALIYPVPEQFKRIILESTLAGVCRGILALTPEAANDIEVWFDYPEPAYGKAIRERLPGVRFDMPLVQCRLSTPLLDRPLAMANPIGLQAALLQCDLEARALNIQSPISVRVKKELSFCASGYPGLEQIADNLGLSARTLRRRLSEEGTSFSTLLAEARHRDAVRLLGNSNMQIAQIALLLGYQDAANFTRSFRKWAGKAPSQFRMQLVDA